MQAILGVGGRGEAGKAGHGSLWRRGAIRTSRASLSLLMDPLRVAFDVGPLAGPRTGVGHAVAAMRDALGAVDDVELVEYIVSFRSTPASRARGGCRSRHCWPTGCGRVADHPRIDRFVGTARCRARHELRRAAVAAPRVVSVYDCWFLRHPTSAGGDVRRPGRSCAGRSPAARPCTPARRRPRPSWPICSPVAAWRRSRWPRCRCPSAPPDPPIPALVGRPYIAAIGTLERRKNLPMLVEAFGLLAAEHARDPPRPRRAPTATTGRPSTRRSTGSIRPRPSGWCSPVESTRPRDPG